MFGSRIVAKAIYERLSATPGVTSVVPANRIQYGLNYRQGTTLPAILYYWENSGYDAGGHTEKAEHITSEELRFVVRVDDEGNSDNDIYPVAQAQLDALAGAVIDTDDGYQITFTANGEAPTPPYNDEGQRYQRLGTIYSVTVTQGAF